MKKSILFVAALAMTFAACKPNYDVEDKTVATFEEAAITPAALDTVFHLAQSGTFTSGAFTFAQEVQDWGEYGVYYFGNIVSNKRDTKYASYLDAEKSACGGPHAGKNFLVWAGGAMEFDGITLKTPAVIPGMYVTNTAWVVDAIKNGDGMTEGGFGKDDFFLLTVTGWLDGKQTDKLVGFYLAEGTDYVDTWEYLPLHELGKVDRITFKLTSSRNNDYGMTTPAYFCIDDLGAKK